MVVPKGFRKRSRVLVYLIIEGFRDTTILGLRLPIEGDKKGGEVGGFPPRGVRAWVLEELDLDWNYRREIRGLGN